MSESDSGGLAELLRAEFRRLASGDPQQELDMVQRVVLAMRAGAGALRRTSGRGRAAAGAVAVGP